MMNAKQLMIGVSFSMMAALSLPAVAEDGKTYPGAACQPLSNTQVFSVNSFGVLFNTSNLAQTVICPVVRDTMAADAANGIRSARVYVIDNNNAAGDPSVTCVLDSRTTGLGFANPGLSESFADTSVGGASPNIQVLDNYVDLTSSEAGYYYFRCSIPGQDEGRRSGIVMYRVYEDD
jgi:hypothetical protein